MFRVESFVANSIQAIKVKRVQQNAFLIIKLLQDGPVTVECHAVAVLPWGSMVDHEDVDLVFERSGTQKAAVDVVRRTTA